MSKAFKSDDGESQDFEDELLDDAESAEEEANPVAKGSKNYITVIGLAALKSELHELLVVERPKVVETVAWAASNGDRSENADYQYGKKRLREIDRRVRFLQKRIDIAEVVDPAQQKGEKVLFGATVVVSDENENKRTYRVVGVDEIDAKTGKISWISPIGQALLQGQVGDFVTVKTPRGDEDLEILEIRFEEFS